MERLTIDEVIEHCSKTCDMTERIAKARGHELESIESNKFWEHYQVRAWLKELKQYKDLEEQGLLLRLPVKAGDTVYKPNPITLSEIVEIKIESIFITESKINISGRTTKMKYSFCCSPSDIGKTVFLTQEEAEQKLKEMESD